MACFSLKNRQNLAIKHRIYSCNSVWIHMNDFEEVYRSIVPQECIFQNRIDRDELERQRRKSIAIEGWLKEQHKKEKKIIKLLLLGIGESGKSTFSKQMKIIHIEGGYSEDERKTVIPIIKKNIKDAILAICEAMQHMNISIEDTSKQKSLEYMSDQVPQIEFDYPQEFYDHVDNLWRDDGVQQCYKRSNEYHLIDSAKYFFDRVHAVRDADYLPTDQDILRHRVRTTTIQRIDFSVQDGRRVDFQLYDVGGQKGERRKWIQVFVDVKSIIFLVDVTCFDSTMADDSTKNKFIETMEVFEQVWNNKYLSEVNVLLFLNKIDLLDLKISQGRSFDQFIDELTPDDPYYEYLIKWKTGWDEPTDKETEEFIKKFPGHGGLSRRRSSVGFRNRRQSIMQIMQKASVHKDTIRTAVFIKQLFKHIVDNPLPSKGRVRAEERGKAWHQHHLIKTFYTCAVDTQNITAVFEGVKTFIIHDRILGL